MNCSFLNLSKLSAVFLFALLFQGNLLAQSTNQVIVKFNYSNLNFELIDDKSVQTIPLQKVLNDKAKESIKELEALYPGIGNYELTKIFPFLTTKDTVSISRMGQKVTIPPFWATFTMAVPSEVRLEKFISVLDSHSPLIEYCHYDFPAFSASPPSDTLYDKQVSLNGSVLHPNAGINIENAWEIETGKPFIKVGIHDSGIDTTHPDVNVVFGGAYFEPDNSNSYEWGEDTYVHGTPIAGLIGAKKDNITGIAGIAGGDTTSGSGCSLFDLRVNFYNQNVASYICASVVDAARSVNTYWDYPDNYNYYNDSGTYFNNTPGFGINIGNHSYVIKTINPIPQDPTDGGGGVENEDNNNGHGNDEDGDDDGNPGQGGDGGNGNPGGGGGGNIDVGPGSILKENNDTIIAPTPLCALCREAYLFSLKNGVINVACRGNSQHFSPSTDPREIDFIYPQSFPDNWIISVGASGYDGLTVQNGLNQSAFEESIDYWSLYGGNMDLIAPGSDSIVFSTHVIRPATVDYPYTKFNGTSAAAPHVTGVVALLLSHYNKDSCYSNRNLSIEDVEYILEHSATNLYGPGYDDTTGWGRLDAYKALQMIENPTKQIVHPDSINYTIEISRDTIALAYNHAFVSDDWGPISSAFPLEVEREYEVVRYLMENQYSFSEYYFSTTDILGYWVRPSASNSLAFYRDTFQYIAPGPPANLPILYTDFEFFDSEPFVEIVDIDSISKTITTRGYYYHFINRYNDVEVNAAGVTNLELTYEPFIEINEWYPVNPFENNARMPVSLYLKDSTFNVVFDFPCDSINQLFDDNFHLGLVDILESNTITIFPNPGYSILNIVCSENQFLDKIEIMDMLGNSVTNHTEKTRKAEIDISNYASGIYVIKCHFENNAKSFKFIKL